MKLQAVMENLHRQQRAKLLMELEQQKQQQAAQNQGQLDRGGGGTAAGTDEEHMGSPAAESEHAQMAALAAMRAAAAGLQRQADSPMSERSSVGDEEDEDDDEEVEEPYKDMMGSEEEEQLKQKWDEDDFEGEMEEDYDDDLADEGLPTGREAITPGKGILLLPHRQMHPHSQLLKPRAAPEQEPRGAALPVHASQGVLVPQDHADWTYEEQFRQLYELDGDPKRKEFLDDLFSFMQKRGTPVNRIPNCPCCHRYMKYLYPYECDKRGLSNPNELQAAIDSNRREGRRQSFGSSLFTYSPNGTPTMLSSPKLSMSSMGMGMGTNGATMTPIQKVKKEDEAVQPLSAAGRLPGALSGHSVLAAQAAAVQTAAAQAAMVAQVAALEQLRDKLEAGEPPEKKMALPAEEHQRLLQRALQHNLLAMTAQMPMNIRINSQDGRQDTALNLTTNGMSSISMSVELNGVVYTGVLYAQGAGLSSSGASASASNSKASGGRGASQSLPHTPTSSTSSNPPL
ncbi:AT-rich interactive domain-containing protein 3A [Alosa sapidissima]|uniref:AT-rich interactive domain-containing protein 3A n=1 Tax=Alosa sapidissima TaxID=34773 RepID=UPI001C095A6C|nr:AT-rich interactive domain-containing protein 3A [Alosa sapidissima]